MNDPYKLGVRPEDYHKKKRRKRRIWTLITVLFIAGITIAVIIILRHLKSNTTLSKGKAITSHIDYVAPTKHWDEPDFSIDLPVAFTAIPKPATTYRLYGWQYSNKGTDGAQVMVYEDTIPTNQALNRVQIVHGQGDHLAIDGALSDNCSQFTKGQSPLPGTYAVPAKWKDVNFFCDQFNKQRDVIGIGSAEGLNFVSLQSPLNGATHKFFITYTNQDITPDYSIFQNTIQSFRLK